MNGNGSLVLYGMSGWSDMGPRQMSTGMGRDFHSMHFYIFKVLCCVNVSSLQKLYNRITESTWKLVKNTKLNEFERQTFRICIFS